MNRKAKYMLAAVTAIVAIVAVVGIVSVFKSGSPTGDVALPAPAKADKILGTPAVERAQADAPAASVRGSERGRVPASRIYLTNGAHVTSSYMSVVMDIFGDGRTVITEVVNDAPVEKGTTCNGGYCS